MSVWEYVKLFHSKSTVFFNFLHMDDEQLRGANVVLRPSTCLAALAIWPYYVRETLADGPTFDLELAEKVCLKEQEHAIDAPDSRKIIYADYNTVERTIVDHCSHLLEVRH